MPKWLPHPLALVYLSGACELLGATGLMLPPLRTAAAWGLIALLVAVFPANLQMLQTAHVQNASTLWQSLLLLRLPLQALMIWWVYAVAIRARIRPAQASP